MDQEIQQPEETLQSVETPPVVDENPKWLPERIARAQESAKKNMLKELGVSDLSEVKSAMELLKQVQSEKLSEKERLESRVKDLEALASKATALEAVVKAKAEQELAALDDKQRDLVNEFAGEDPAAVLKTIAKFRNSGMFAPKIVTTQTAPTAPAPMPTQAPEESLEHKYRAMLADPRRAMDRAFMLLANPELASVTL